MSIALAIGAKDAAMLKDREGSPPAATRSVAGS
jgi:hypothetical protein